MNNYRFTSERLGFRNWRALDLKALAAINADPEVMRYFPATQSSVQTGNFIQRMQHMFRERSYCYFAVDELSTGNFIGFIGLAYQEYSSPFNPAVDVGWRIARAYWGKGYATEGGQKCLQYGLNMLNMKAIYSVAPMKNQASIRVMQKIGMLHHLDFNHPALTKYPSLQPCRCYRITSN